jgi:hypothetical protein
MPLQDGEWTDLGIFTALGMNIAIACGLVVAFSILRRVPSNRLTYRPRSVDRVNLAVATGGVDPHWTASDACFHERHMFSWLTNVMAIADIDILEKCGFDALFFIKFERYALRLVVTLTALCTCVLLPINNTGRNNRETALASKLTDKPVLYLRGFNDWLITNLSDGSALLWVHLAIFVVVCLSLYSIVLKLTEDFYLTRKLFMRRQGKNIQVHASNTSVLIRGLPLALRTEAPLRDRLEKMYGPGSVRTVFLQFQCDALIKLRAKETELMVALDAAEGSLAKTGKRPTRKVGAVLGLLGGKKRDAIESLTEELEELRVKISEEAAKPLKSTGAAFVNFVDITTAKRMVQNFFFFARAEMTKLEAPAGEPPFPATYWEVELAPMPMDVVWANLGVPPSKRSVAAVVIAALTVVLVLFWGLPVGFLGSIQNLCSIPGVGSVFKPFLKMPGVIFGLVSTYLPVVVVVVFNILLPVILTKFSLAEGLVSQSAVRCAVLERFFLFTLFSVIILPTLVVGSLGRLAILLNKIADDVLGQVLSLLVSLTTPKTSMYLGYMIQLGIFASALNLLQLAPLIVGRIKRRMAYTPHQLKTVLSPPEFNYALSYPLVLLVLAMNVLFCLTLPITCMFGTFFFACKVVADKYFITQIAQTARPSDGSMPRSCIRIIMRTVVIFQVATIGTFFGKKAIGPGIVAAVFSLLSIVLIKAVNAKLEAVFKSDLYIPDAQDIKLAEEEIAKVQESLEQEAEEQQKQQQEQEQEQPPPELGDLGIEAEPASTPTTTSHTAAVAPLPSLQKTLANTKKAILSATSADASIISAKNMIKIFVNPGLIAPAPLPPIPAKSK